MDGNSTLLALWGILWWLFSLYIFWGVYFLDVFFRKWIVYIFLDTVIFPVFLHHFIVHLMKLRIILESVSVPKSIQTVICWWTTWRNTSNHHDLWFFLFRNKRIPKNEREFWCSKRYMISFVIHSSDAFF